MYGPASSDLVNARMADHRRYANHVRLENAAKRLRAERLPRRSWHSEFIAFVKAFARRLAVPGRQSRVQTIGPAARLKSAAN
jgi:hypothetical protein